MTITRLWQAGAEMNNVLSEFTTRNSASFDLTTTSPKTGTYAFSTTSNAYATRNFGTTYTQGRIGFHINHNGVSTGQPAMFRLRSGATSVLELRWNSATSEFEVYCGATKVANTAVTAFAPTGIWYHIGVDFKFHASTGWVNVYLDGNSKIAYSGNTTQGGSNFDTLDVGSPGSSWASPLKFDDIFIEDTTGEGAAAQVPDYRYEMIKPSSDNTPNAWTPNSGSTHYTQVDDVAHDSDTTYLEVNTTSQEEEFGMEDITLPAGWSIVSVIPVAIARKVDAGGTLGLQFKVTSGGSSSTGATQSFGTSYSTAVWERFTTKPAGGAWDEAAVDGLEMSVISA